jgi:hypothetical protein
MTGRGQIDCQGIEVRCQPAVHIGIEPPAEVKTPEPQSLCWMPEVQAGVSAKSVSRNGRSQPG